MVLHSENEIQVLGYPPKQKNKWKWIVSIFIVGIALVLSFVFFQQEEEDIDLRTFKTELKAPPPRKPEPEMTSGVEYTAEVINDVYMHFFRLIDMPAILTTDISEYMDSTECFIIQAADIRKDNGQFVGDFVLNGKKLAVGKHKKGYCSIVNGEINIGISDDDEVMNQCIAQGGSFFRQYPLVVDGVMQKSTLKGKSIRRALAKKSGEIYIVETDERESMHNFAEALQDIGVTLAISLVGGDESYMHWLQEGELYENYELEKVTNRNFLVFKRKE